MGLTKKSAPYLLQDFGAGYSFDFADKNYMVKAKKKVAFKSYTPTQALLLPPDLLLSFILADGGAVMLQFLFKTGSFTLCLLFIRS